jgi:hypothetical protein
LILSIPCQRDVVVGGAVDTGAARSLNPSALAASGGASSVLNDTSFINQIAGALAHPFKVGFSESMSLVFLTASMIMAIGLVVITFLPELPLGQRSAVQERAQEDPAQEAATTAGG